MKGVAPDHRPLEQARMARMLERPFTPPDPLTRGDLMIGLMLFAAAFLLRLLNIGAPSLWVDEGASLGFTQASWQALFTTVPLVETNPPAYYGLLKAWTTFAGQTEGMLRLPGAFASALAVLVLFLSAQRTYGRAVAIMAAAFLALSAPQVAFAQEARVFAFVTLAFVTGLAMVNLLTEALGDGRRVWPQLLGLSVATAALPHLHYSGFFVAVILLTYALALVSLKGLLIRSILPMLAAVLVTALLAAPPIYWAWVHFTAPDSSVGWLAPPSPGVAKWTYHETFGIAHLPFGRPTWLPDEVPQHRAFNLLATRRLAEAVLFIVCAVGLIAAIRRKERTVPALVIAFLSLLVMFYGVSQFKPILLQRTVIFGLPLIALIAGYGVVAFRWSWAVFPVALALLGTQAANVDAYYPKAEKEPWRALISDLAGDMPEGAAMILISGPYMPASLMTATLVAHYWPDMPKEAVFATAATNAEGVSTLGFGYNPWVRKLNAETLCQDLSGHDTLVLVYRDAAHLGAIAPLLAENGSDEIGAHSEGLLGYQSRTGVSCGN